MTPAQLRDKLRQILDALLEPDVYTDDRETAMAVTHVAALVAINDTLRDIASELSTR